MKQIFEGIRVIHAAGLIHRDIKCDNILLHSPPGSGRVYAKIADFGLAKKENLNNDKEKIYTAGTLPYQAPEMFMKPLIVTQKADIYAVGITFYRLITHRYPVNERNHVQQHRMVARINRIERPQEIIDDFLWDLLSKLLEFDPDKRITAAQALQHPYFTSPEALADISIEQYISASWAKEKETENINKFDRDPSFIVS
ncbi:MAG: putative serine/threonine-protein kinase H1, partial [Streblomastix strix]